eukprot:gene5869-8094_t
MSNENDDSKTSDTNGTNNNSRPPVIPFDLFVREDVIIKPKAIPPKSNDNDNSNNNKPIREFVSPRNNRDDDNARPTGYDQPDEDDDIDEENNHNKNIANSLDSENANDSYLVKLFKDLYIGSVYDSRKKQQARYVIKNITFISFAIGFIFTAIWFAFPGKFISVRGNNDEMYTSRYKTSYVDPDNLLQSEFMSSDAEYFDDASGLPEKEETRFAPPPVNPLIQAPDKSIDL